jgi:N-acetylneuraminic acid mutarotase
MNKKAFTGALVIVAILCTVAVMPAFAQTSDYWTEKAPLPYAAGSTYGNVAVWNGKIYAVLAGNTLVVYDPASDSWANVTALPAGVNSETIASCNNKFYVFSVNQGVLVGDRTEVVNVYDPQTGAWETAAAKPGTAVQDIQADVVNGKIYLIGGLVVSGIYAYSFYSSNWVYDPAPDSWSQTAPMPLGVSDYASCVVDDQIYVIGGIYNYVGYALFTNLVQIYNTQTNQWSQGTSMPYNMSQMGAAVTTGLQAQKNIYVMGGITDTGNSNYNFHDVDLTQVYNPQTGWSTGTTMPTARSGLSLANVNDTLYALGGVNSTSLNGFTTNEQYTPASYGVPTSPTPWPFPSPAQTATPTPSPTLIPIPSPSPVKTQASTQTPASSPTSTPTLKSTLTPTPTLTATAAPSLSQTTAPSLLTSSPSIPEFPAWVIPSIFLAAAFAVVMVTRRKKQTGPRL